MTRLHLVAGLLIGAIAIAVADFARFDHGPEQAELTPTARQTVAGKPDLAIVTSLPIMFAERFSLDAPVSPVRERLERDYRLVPVGVADAIGLKRQSMLLMAHARAQPASALADLDKWVRGGGRLLILTDPRLDWHSSRPLGDSLRPPVNFADTGLLTHWGLTLSGPDPVGETLRSIDGQPVATSSPGSLVSTGDCTVETGGFVARCDIGKGRVTVIADADWLNTGSDGDSLQSSDPHNLDALVRELARLRNS
nr:hypothetical protein [uncultured Sphingomonas sp.]